MEKFSAKIEGRQDYSESSRILKEIRSQGLPWRCDVYVPGFLSLLLNVPSGSKLTIWKDAKWIPDGFPFDPIDIDRRTQRTSSILHFELAATFQRVAHKPSPPRTQGEQTPQGERVSPEKQKRRQRRARRDKSEFQDTQSPCNKTDRHLRGGWHHFRLGFAYLFID